mmetsp:Transcript_108881/g.222192  ORF Transcript_108881/g.222192 Transcript_108881/m.222192 type:complete len:93 (+) Transcript_108881:1354-1632(+)
MRLGLTVYFIGSFDMGKSCCIKLLFPSRQYFRVFQSHFFRLFGFCQLGIAAHFDIQLQDFLRGTSGGIVDVKRVHDHGIEGKSNTTFVNESF